MRILKTLAFLSFVLVPVLAAASDLVITTDPPNASVQLDGVGYGQAPVTIPKVAAGPHLLRVSAEGYETRIDSVELSGGEQMTVHAPLQRKAVVVTPAPQAVAPVRASALDPSAEQRPQPAVAPAVQPSAPGAQPAAAAPVAAPPSAPQATMPTPVSQLPVAWGTQRKTFVLIVETEPVGAEVQVIGLPGSKPSPATFTGFAKGTLKLLVSAPGYQEKRVAVDLEGDSRTRVVLEKK